MAENTYRLCSISELSLEKTFECGQCFRWNIQDDGSYFGMAGGYPARLWTQDDSVFIKTPDGAQAFWRDYFDMDVDYAAASVSFESVGYLEECRNFGLGIRILRQNKWEALCSFIISQCNNIPRIKGIVERLCTCFGDAVEFDGELTYTFPEVEKIARLEPEELSPLKCGYRAPYITNAARAIVSGELDLTEISAMEPEAAVKKLKSLYGVGAKVANCVILYGLHIMSGFPIDTWMKKALKEHFPAEFDPKTLGPYAGLAQQYIFYYTRSGENR